tara:strand:- start:2418 stop:2684 length:267 start_codon:yes stop_codon:yes gene_type:complete
MKLTEQQYEIGPAGIIRVDQLKIKYEERQQYLNDEAKEFDIVDIVETAALIGVEYGDGYSSEEAKGIVICNPLSMVSKVLDRLKFKGG